MAKSQMEFIKEAEDSLEGFNEVNAQTMAIPFLKLAQDLTPQTKKAKKDAYIEGLEPGMFFNSATLENFETALKFIVIKFERIYIEWMPNRGGFVGYHSPEHAESIAENKTFGKWQTADGNDLQEYYTYYGIIVDRESEGPVILSLTSSAIKVAKGLNRLMTTHIMDNGKRAMPYYLVWNLESVHMEKNENDWFMPKFTFDGYINEEQYNLVSIDRKALPDKPVDYAQIEDRSAGATVNDF